MKVVNPLTFSAPPIDTALAKVDRNDAYVKSVVLFCNAVIADEFPVPVELLLFNWVCIELVASRKAKVAGVIPFKEVVNKLTPSSLVVPKTCNLYDGLYQYLNQYY